MRYVVATCCLALAPATATALPSVVAPGQEYSVQVGSLVGSGIPRARQGDGQIDFGHVSAYDAGPRTGRRYVLPNGDMVLVQSVQLIVVAESPPALTTLGSARHSGAGRPDSTVSDKPIRPSVGADTVRRPVSIYTVVAPNADDVGVIAAPAGSVDWSTAQPPLAPGYHLLTAGVMPGEPVAVDVGMYVAAGANGTVQASVSFEAR